jgi:hypothetical protein
MGLEHRSHLRREIELVVHAIAPDGATIPCWLSDISEGGARLLTAKAVALPDQFILKPSNKLRRWCRVAWRADQAVGLQFIEVSADTAKGAPPSASQKMRPVMVTCKQNRQAGSDWYPSQGQ